MLNGKTVTIEHIIEQLYRDYSFDNINKSEVAEWIWNAMGLIGTPYPFEDKPKEITIIEYKAELPIDLYSILAVREKTTGIPFREMTDLFQKFGLGSYENGTEVETPDVDPLTGENYDTYIGPDTSSEYYTYKVQGNYIFTGMENGTIEMAYKAIPIDVVTGMPVVAEDVAYIRGIVSFIAERLAFRMMLKDMITERKYDIIRSDYLFNVGAAKNSCHQLNPSRMETLINRWKSTYIGPEHFDTGLRYLGSRE